MRSEPYQTILPGSELPALIETRKLNWGSGEKFLIERGYVPGCLAKCFIPASNIKRKIHPFIQQKLSHLLGKGV